MTETDESVGGKLNYLRVKKVGDDCKRCNLCEHRTKVVFGEGNPEADVMIIGEAPGFNEDQQGRPFVGKAGSMLDRWLSDAGLKRADVYITNVVKCRPENNRDPKSDEVETCSKFLRVQIALIRPKVLVTLGRIAGNILSGQDGTAMRVLRSRPWLYEDDRTSVKLPVCCLYHPAWVLRQGSNPYNVEAFHVAVKDLQEALRVGNRKTLPEPLEKAPEPEPEPEPEADVMDLFGA